jgi:hypothetical protein
MTGTGDLYAGRLICISGAHGKLGQDCLLLITVSVSFAAKGEKQKQTVTSTYEDENTPSLEMEYF